MSARIELHQRLYTETVGNRMQTGATIAGGLLRQNKLLKRRAGGEGDCDFEAAGITRARKAGQQPP
ncbi:hypothetical protein GCM10011400_40170 [Paraburkholderia caffeinilytica]|uniref:Uncharacterized protein n=1 Tax=Paraburkholderia caffeinilytica TaxID=1761016 RepID=A0ABQ1N1A1_9BURK|nr:hypothetical protein GCM10011400_40170 [Paraburkholderia caffeinilytica]